MKKIYDATLGAILPDSIVDEQISALAKAVDTEIKKLSAQVQEVLHLPRLDELDGDILDNLAEQFHVDRFDSSILTDEQKRDLIRESIAQHRRKGTVWAVEKVVKSFFREPKVLEWFKYGGEPYRFKISTRGFTSSPKSFKTFMNMLNDAKNVRSHLDVLELDLSPDENTQLRAGMARFVEGTKNISLTEPGGTLSQVNVGSGFFIEGSEKINPARPSSQAAKIYAGVAMSIGGEITIGLEPLQPLPEIEIPPSYALDYEDFFISENPIADMLVVDMGITRDFNFTEPLDLDDMTADTLKLFFAFPISRHRRYRAVTVKNPRPDVTREEMKAVGQFVADKKIIMNALGEYANGVFAAALKKTDVTEVF